MPLIDPNHIFNAWSAVFGVQRWGLGVLGFLLCVNVACWCLDAEGTGFLGPVMAAVLLLWCWWWPVL